MAMSLCIRCGGLLVRERLFEASGMSSTEQVECDRCVNCGALEDTIIRANRQPARPPCDRGNREGLASDRKSSPRSWLTQLILTISNGRTCLRGAPATDAATMLMANTWSVLSTTVQSAYFPLQEVPDETPSHSPVR